MFEDDDFTMDVQVGPETEITASVGESPVDIAKKNPKNVCVASKVNVNGVREFFVEFDDVAKYAELNERCLIDSLNDIVACNEDTGLGMTRDNLIMIVNEDSMEYVNELENHGAKCMRIMTEAESISMDVQVGPGEEEIRMAEDPQEANPVDAVKRQYDNVVVAKQGDEFFTDVEDVQKCADLNCESVIDTLNGIISVNEETGINTDNLVVVVNEFTSNDTIDKFNEAGVILCESEETKKRKNVGKEAVKIINDVLVNDNVSGIRASKGLYNPIQSHKFNKGKGDLIVRLLFRMSAIDASRDMNNAMKAIKSNKSYILKSLNKVSDTYFTDIKMKTGIGATIDVIIK